jgi:hypothetical protein
MPNRRKSLETGSPIQIASRLSLNEPARSKRNLSNLPRSLFDPDASQASANRLPKNAPATLNDIESVPHSQANLDSKKQANIYFSRVSMAAVSEKSIPVPASDKNIPYPQTLETEEFTNTLQNEEDPFTIHDLRELDKIWLSFKKINRTLIHTLTNSLIAENGVEIYQILHENNAEFIQILRNRIQSNFLKNIYNCVNFTEHQCDIYIDNLGMINSRKDNYSKNTREKSFMLRNKLVPVQLLKPYYKFFVGDKYKELKNQIKKNMSYFVEHPDIGDTHADVGKVFFDSEMVNFLFFLG